MFFIKWCRRHLLLAHISLLAFIAFWAILFWYLAEWFWGGGRQTFESLHSYGFIWVSIAIASVAALNSMLASSIASEAQRPFISLQPGTIPVIETVNEITIKLEIKNTGTMPGNDVTADIGFFDEDEEITEANMSKKYPTETQRLPYLTMFPNATCHITYMFDLGQETAMKLWKNLKKGKVRFRLRIMYTSLGRKHITIQSEQIEKTSKETGELHRSPVPPQTWK
ncbi:MAG: hypothetical protein MUO17_04210 [Dehalococcoidales bacterium]|nr:hypothetical protein [Dehalococcoidales bacterium]